MKEKIKPRTLIVCCGQTKIALKTTNISVPESFWNKAVVLYLRQRFKKLRISEISCLERTLEASFWSLFRLGDLPFFCGWFGVFFSN